MNMHNTVANRLPVWALTAVTLILVSYVGVLGGVAILSERDVEFWPPKIGPGPKSKLVDEFRETRVELIRVIFALESQLGLLNERLNDARKYRADTYEDEGSESDIWQKTVGDLKNDIEKYEEKLIKRVDMLEKYISSTEQRLSEL